MKKSKKFWTKFKEKDEEIFLSLEDANRFLNEQKKITAVNLFPFNIQLDFITNSNYTDREKKRINIRTKGKIVSLIGLYSKINSISLKGSGKYTSCAVGDFLIAKKICKKQRGHYDNLYYEIFDKKLFDFFEGRGYKKEFLEQHQPYRVSFTKPINNEEEANQNYDDIYNFDRTYNSKNISSRNIIFEKISKL